MVSIVEAGNKVRSYLPTVTVEPNLFSTPQDTSALEWSKSEFNIYSFTLPTLHSGL